MSTLNFNELRGHETTDFRIIMPSDAYINVNGTFEVEDGRVDLLLHQHLKMEMAVVQNLKDHT